MRRTLISGVVLVLTTPWVVLAEEPPISPTVVTTVTPTATTALTPTPPASVRATVKAWEPSKEIPALINMLVNDDPLVQMEARQELLLTGRKTVVPFLLQSLEKAKPELRYMIVEILAELRDEQSVPVLVKLLGDKDEHTTSVASVAARALGKIAEPSAIPALLKTAVATDVELRYETIQALGLVLRGQDITTTQTAIPYIKAALTDTVKTFQGYLLKAAAVQALGRLKDTSSVKDLMGIIRNPDVEEATDMPIARYVIRALIQITDYQTELPSIKLQNPDNTKKKEEIIKKWEEWWEQNKKNY